MRTYTLTNSSRGGVLVETAIILPLVLAVLLILLWFGVMSNAQASLTQAVNNSVRLAITRSDGSLVAESSFPEIDAWLGPGGATTVPSALYVNPIDSQNQLVELNADQVSSDIFHNGNPIDLSQFPPVYAYSMAYLNQALQRSIGTSVRFPCEPNGPGKDGCVNCSFLNPLDGSTSPFLGPFSAIPNDSIGIECRMIPGSPFVRIISGTLRMLTGGGYQGTVITRSKFYAAAPD